MSGSSTSKVHKDWDADQFSRPTREGDAQLEVQGMAPIPDDGRYGRKFRLFTVWFAPNLVPAAVFTGTLATASFIGLSLWWGIAAIVVGNILGALPASFTAIMGPRTGMPQLPLSRIAFGRTIAVPGLANWLTTIAWDAINALFGSEALVVLFHLPFWLGLLIIIAAQGTIAVFGFEFIHTFEKWASVILGVVFVILTVKIALIGNIHVTQQTHGGAAVGGFLLMVAIVAGFTIGYGGYASDYTRYFKADISAWAVGWRTLAGLALSSAWLEILGLLVASKLAADQTSAGLYHLMGGGFLGVIAMLGIAMGTVAIDAMDDYTGSLSLQSTGIRISRPVSAAIVGIGGFALALYMYEGNVVSTFENIVLFSGYWAAPYCAIILSEWWLRKGKVNVRTLLHLRDLEIGWEGLTALLVGFGAAVPFMDATIFVGSVSSGPLHGGDLAYEVGFVVAGIVYLALRSLTRSRRAAAAIVAPEPVGVGASAADIVVTSSDLPPAEAAGQA
jgi:nucleobase:cation symporter-1, NCS1 family